MKVFLSIVGAILAFLMLVVGLNFFGLANYSFFAPKYEAARREVFENTQSYQQGSIRDFDNLYLAYTRAKSEDEKAIILETLRHRTAGVQEGNIPARIRLLLNK